MKTVELQAVQIANGANELLGEVSASKITGEEERYSHIDLVDFEANVEGAEAAFEAVEPLLAKKDPKLAKEIEASFEDVYASLEPYRQRRRLRPLHRAEQGRHPQAGAGNRRSRRGAVTGARPDRRLKTHSLAAMTVADRRTGPTSCSRELGFESWRPGQREAVEAALEGRDSLIVMPTGGGKSLCYQLPGLATRGPDDRRQPADRADERPVAAADRGRAPGGDDLLGDERRGGARDALDQVRGGEARIVYCSPERFASTVFLDALAQRRIDLLAVDEAHCVSEWGHDFRPDYLRLPEIAERLGRPTVMACTATATKAVAAEIVSRFGMREPLQVRSGFDRPNLSFDVVAARGQGLEGAAAGAARSGPRRPGEPAGDRLLRHPHATPTRSPQALRDAGPAARSPTTPAWRPRTAPRPSAASWPARPR